MSNSNGKRTLLVCRGTGCNSLNAGQLHETLENLIAEYNLTSSIDIKLTGCHGFCQVGPTIIVEPDNVLYVHLTEKSLREIIEQHLVNNTVVEKYLYEDPKTGETVENKDNIDFYSKQIPIITEYCGVINPENIDEYIDLGGYSSLKKVLTELQPQDVIDTIRNSRLRGRGGAGFTTGQKWQFCRDAKGSPKYLICNADEGDPGAFMDRSILESDPHSVIEGMVIAAYAIGASSGYVYIRAEYPLAIDRFVIALDQARERGFLGENICNLGFNFDLILKKGAGAFVCGEETALIASIMGKRGMPRPRPPFPATSGLWEKPTNNNNVKTYAFIPRVIRSGPEWFNTYGTEDASGTLVVAVTGKVKNSGLVEVPMGTAIRELVYDIGGGILNDKKFKAVQMGGPSGGCIPERLADTKMDYASITALGSIMGSGGFIVLDEETCMVDLAHYFISFTQNESCGKCAPCRIGTRKMLEILGGIKEGKASMEDLEKLERLAKMIKKTSLCGLGQTAPNPVLTTIQYFREEYEAHILEKRCPALVCKDLITYSIQPDICTGCSVCKNDCPSGAITGESKEPHQINPDICNRCGLCFSLCPNNSIIKKPGGSKI